MKQTNRALAPFKT